MNRFVFFIVMLSLISLTCCEKEHEPDDASSFLFEATVMGNGLDCGETYLISLTQRGSNSDIEDGMYYAYQLDPEFKEPGLKVYLNCRQPNDSELQACTMMGPTYQHLIVIDCKRKED